MLVSSPRPVSRRPRRRRLAIAALLGLLAASGSAGATTYVWPISNSATPDEMNTSFGPRINYSKWDFHDGVDLPGSCGTNVHAVATGTVVSAGPANPPTWNSRHVVIKVSDTNDGDVFVYYLHLQSIHAAVSVNETVSQGQVVGQLGQDDATYCHLHLEFRRGSSQQVSSIHPLRYLPYTNTANFTAPTGARFNRQSDGLMAARLLFDASSKLEGDLARVEVDLKNGTTLLATRVVEFNDKTTINEGNGDELAFVGDIAVEGYQSSNMVADGRTDLEYGVVVRSLPGNCDTLVARVQDLGGNTATSAAIAVPDQTAVEQSLDFENGLATPAGWVERTTPNRTAIANDQALAQGGARSLLSTDQSTASSSQQAGIEYSLMPGRFEWLAEAWIRPSVLDLPAAAKQVYLLHFLDQGAANLSVAARIRNSGPIVAGIAARRPNGTTTGKDSSEVIGTGTWRKWTLRLLRVATRETTAVLYLDGQETTRFTWDSTGYEPLTFRVGIGQSFSQVRATLNTDGVLVTEKTM